MDDKLIKSILDANKNKGFVKRILRTDNYKPLDNGDGSSSTHSMAAEVDEKGEWRVFPTVLMTRDGVLRRFELREAQRITGKTGNYISFGKDKDKALWFSENYKRAWSKDFLR